MIPETVARLRELSAGVAEEAPAVGRRSRKPDCCGGHNRNSSHYLIR